jgi:putative hydrolase of the HAD superfamily
MSRIKVVFFDAAGTLFHVKGSVGEVYLRHAAKYGVKQTPAMLDSLNAAFHRAFKDAPAPVFAVKEPAEIKRCERLWWFDIVHNVYYRVGMFEGFDDYFDEVFEAFSKPDLWALYPETLGTLRQLRGQGLELGIISNFDTRLFGVLRGLELDGLFETVTISSLAQSAKPAPKIFRRALEEHAVDPDECLHVGDSLREDVQGAEAAGITGVLIDRELPAAVGAAGTSIHTIPSLDRIPSLLASL